MVTYTKKALVALSLIGSVTVSTQCMFVNGVKAVLNGVGNVIGLSPALVTPPVMAYATYKVETDPVTCMEKVIKTQTRGPSADEEAFLRPHVGEGTTMRIVYSAPLCQDQF